MTRIDDFEQQIRIGNKSEMQLNEGVMSRRNEISTQLHQSYKTAGSVLMRIMPVCGENILL